ncbi:MAG: hypothetical protein QM723_27335 [Myxococcaceae bacterium]
MHIALIATLLGVVPSKCPAQDGNKPAPYCRCDAHESGCTALKPLDSNAARSAVSTRTEFTDALGGTINATVLEALIKQRASQVTQSLILDLLRTAAKRRDLPLVLEDFVGVMASLIASVGDKETQIQTVTTGVIRDGLTLGVGAGVSALGTGGDKCKGLDAVLDTTYEALALAPALSGLGFPVATGKVPDGCDALATTITKWADVLGNAGDPAALKSDLDTLSSCLNPGSGVTTLAVADAGTNSLVSELENANGVNSPCEALRVSVVERLKGVTSTQAVAVADRSAITSALAPLDLSGAKALPPIVVQALKSVLFALAHQKPIARGDLVVLINEVSVETDNAWPRTNTETDGGVDYEADDAKKIVDDFLVSLPTAIRQDKSAPPSDIKLDAAALAAQMVSNYVDEHKRGFYLRATVGSGVLLAVDKSSQKYAPSLHEELGFGWRWQPMKQLLHGPHLGVSGLLYKLQLNKQTVNDLFAFLGWSFNLYRLLDVSLSGGVLHNPDTGNDRFGMTLSLQIPLADYLTDAMNSPSTDNSSSQTK